MGKRTGKPRGRPPGTFKHLDLERLRTLAMIGMPVNKMARLLGCSIDLLDDRYRAEIEHARQDGESRILGKTFQLALGGNTRLLELCLINRCQWTNRPEVMVNVTQNTLALPDVTQQTKEKLAQLHQLIRREALLGMPNDADGNGNGDSKQPTP